MTHNILALSDIHLGSDLKDGAARCLQLDDDLCAFLRHYAGHLALGRRWKLIFAGDLVDFLQVTVVPDGGGGIDVTDEERLFGLHDGEDRAAWKLRRVFQRHQRVVDELARFVLAGHSLAVVRGNHDLEFYWPAVQEAFKEMLAEAGGLASRPEREAFLARVQFYPWFYLEPGRIYLEHGHVHDEHSTTASVLEPLAPEDPRRLDMPVSSLALRYFGTKYADKIDVNEVESWGMVDYLRWMWRVGNPWRIFADYLSMVWRVLVPVYRRSRRLGARVVRDPVEQVRGLLGRFVGGGEEMARMAWELVRLARPPASRRLLDALQLLFVDRLLLIAAAVAMAGGCAAAPVPLWARGAGLVVVLGAVLSLNRWLGRRRQSESSPKLMAAAHRLGSLFGVRYVVMGHSHKPIADHEIGGGTRYFNLGTWCRSASGQRPRTGLTHLVIEGDRAELRKWDA